MNDEFDKRKNEYSKSDTLSVKKDLKTARVTKNNELEEQWNIRKIEMRKQRDKYINEHAEKNELQLQHSKLDEAYKDQAQEISNYKHRTSELKMGIEEKKESLSSLVNDVSELKEKLQKSEDDLIKLRTEVNELENNDKLDKAIDELPIEKLKQ